MRESHMAYRDDLTALSARHEALTEEVLQKTRELEASRRLLEQAQARAKLPVLDNLRVATPCTAAWNQMTGDDRARHCGDCQKTVYNLSGLTREEAEALVIEKNGELCVRYFQRHDGTILLADCAIGVKRRRRRQAIAAGAATLLAGAAAAAITSHLQHHERLRFVGDTRHVMGLMVNSPNDPPRSHDVIHDEPAGTPTPTIPDTQAPIHVKMGKAVRVP